MPTITYEVVQKPIDQRILDAASIYWNKERSYFNQTSGKTTLVYRRSILFFLLRRETELSYGAIAALFGLTSHEWVMKSIDNVDARKNIYQQINNDLIEIEKIAGKLNAKFISCNFRLHTLKPASK